MAKRKPSTRKPTTPARKVRAAAVKPAAKSTAKPAAKKQGITARSAKARAAKARTTKHVSPLAATVGRCVATVDGWRKQCAGKLHELVHERAGRKSHRRPSRRRGDLDTLPQRLAAQAKRVGQSVRNIELDDVKQFCRREWQELMTMARKLDQLANRRGERAKRRAK